MKNKNVGFLIAGIGIVIGIMIGIFNKGIRDNIALTCSHGPDCAMYTTLSIQTWISLAVAALIILIGIFFIFAKEPERTIIKKIRPEASIQPKKFSKKTLKDLNAEERKIINLILQNKGSIFQSELAEKGGFNKVRITRILDSLEGQGLIQRQRRGMTNIVLLNR